MRIELIILAILALSGIASILHQLKDGFKKTNLSDKYVWGIYIQGCFFLSSMAVGILMIIAAILLLGIQGLDPLLRTGNILAFSFLLGAQALLGLDLGKPMRAVFMIKSKNFRSPLTLDFYSMGLSTVLSLIFLLGALPLGGPLSGIWGILVLAAGSLCIAAHTMFFLSRIKGGFQSNSFLGLESLLYSLLGGAAVLSLVAIANGTSLNIVAPIMLILVVLLITAILSHKIALLTMDKKHDEKVILLLNGLTLILLAVNQLFIENHYLVLGAAVLALIGLFAEKYHAVIHSQSANMIPEPYSQFLDKKVYRPSFKEWNILVGSFAICILLSYGIAFLNITL